MSKISVFYQKWKAFIPGVIAGLAWTGLIMSSGCASQRALTGGPKDTIPPRIVSSNPANLSLNFKGKKIRLTFNEYVQLKNAKKDIIITPSNDIKYDIKLKAGRTLEFTFEEPLDSNTTYTFNMQEAVQDVTEKNPLEENVFTFSTGDELDSMQIHGKVVNILTDLPEKDAVVGIYKLNDTLDIFNSKPLYFTKTDEFGVYSIAHIQVGDYKLYTFIDKNGNLTYDPKTEFSGFYPDTLKLNQVYDSIKLNIVPVNMDTLYMNKALTSGRYFVTSFNKSIVDYKAKFTDKMDSLPSNLMEDNKTIRFYNTREMTEADSAKVHIVAYDSVNNQVDSTLYVKFRKTKRKLSKMDQKLSKLTKRYITNDFKIEIAFTKPIGEETLDSAFFQFDSLNVLPIEKTDLTWNHSFNKVQIRKNLKLDTIIKPDSVELEGFSSVSMILKDNAFTSIEQDSSKRIKESYSFSKEDNVGTILGKVTTTSKSYILQLLNEKNVVVDQKYNPKKYTFTNVDPGKYRLRILVDEDGSGSWDPGNIKKGIPPEPVEFYSKVLILRANWELPKEDMTF